MNSLKNPFLGVATLCCFLTSAQTQSRLQLAFEFGPNYSALRGNEMVERFHKPAIALAAGLVVQYELFEFLSLRSAVMYERRSTSTEITVTDVTGLAVGKVTHGYNFNYLTVPLMVRLESGEGIRFFGQVGPYLSCLVNQTIELKGSNLADPNNTWLYNKLDMGVSAGIGVAVPVGNRIKLSLEIRNSLGLTNISAVPIYNGGSLMWNSTAVLFGLNYRLGTP